MSFQLIGLSTPAVGLKTFPIGKTRNALSNSHIAAISAAATKKAQEMGHPPIILERVAGAIKRIKVESAEERFTRLVSMIEDRFGRGILTERAVAHLKRAIHFRGRAAHGYFGAESDVEFRALSKSIHAMEALCYLLTALDLPISNAGMMRIGSHRVIRDYSLAYD